MTRRLVDPVVLLIVAAPFLFAAAFGAYMRARDTVSPNYAPAIGLTIAGAFVVLLAAILAVVLEGEA